MSRTYRHTKPEFVYRLDDDGWIADEEWQEARKHFDQYKGWRYAAQLRNRKSRRDRKFVDDWDNYAMPVQKTGWWAD